VPAVWQLTDAYLEATTQLAYPARKPLCTSSSTGISNFSVEVLKLQRQRNLAASVSLTQREVDSSSWRSCGPPCLQHLAWLLVRRLLVTSERGVNKTLAIWSVADCRGSHTILELADMNLLASLQKGWKRWQTRAFGSSSRHLLPNFCHLLWL
jgi:hypothetical protein